VNSENSARAQALRAHAPLGDALLELRDPCVRGSIERFAGSKRCLELCNSFIPPVLRHGSMASPSGVRMESGNIYGAVWTTYRTGERLPIKAPEAVDAHILVALESAETAFCFEDADEDPAKDHGGAVPALYASRGGANTVVHVLDRVGRR
jgi:hypothetical protein